MSSENNSYVEKLLAALQSDKIESQINAIYFLAKEGDKRAIQPLLNILMDTEEDSEVRQAAAKALGELGDRSTITTLQWVEENDLEGTCWAASAKHEITAAIENIKRRYTTT